MSDELFSGWGGPWPIPNVGITRCPTTDDLPHDNAMTPSVSRYIPQGRRGKIMTGMFEVSLVPDFHRLPELFCGFVRRPGQGLTRYPVACNPQAWAAGSAFMVLQACLRFVDCRVEQKVIFNHPILPDFIDKMQIKI